MSEKSAEGDGGKKVCLKIADFSLFVVAVLLIVGIYDGVNSFERYFLIVQIDSLSILSTYSFYFLCFALVISFTYSWSFSFHTLFASGCMLHL